MEISGDRMPVSAIAIPRGNVASALWRNASSVAIAGGLRQLRETIQADGCRAEPAQTWSAISRLLQRADFSDLIVQQEIQALLPQLLGRILDRQAPPAESRAALEALSVVQNGVRVDPDLEHLYWVRILYPLGREVAQGRALPPGFHSWNRSTTDPQNEAILRHYFASPANPESIRTLALLAWSGLAMSRLAGRVSDGEALPLLRLAEDEGAGHLFRRLAYQAYLQIRQEGALGVLEVPSVERVFLTLLSEAESQDRPWRETVEEFSSMLRSLPMRERATLRFLEYLDRVPARESLNSEGAQGLLSVHRTIFSSLLERRDTISPLMLRTRQSHLRVLARFLDDRRFAEMRVELLEEYARGVEAFRREAVSLGTEMLALPELRRGVRGMQGVLANAATDPLSASIASQYLSRALESVSDAERIALDQWAGGLATQSGIPAETRCFLLQISMAAASLQANPTALARIEGELTALLVGSSSATVTGAITSIYTQFLERTLALSRTAEVVEHLTSRILREEESLENRLAMLRLFNAAMNFRVPERRLLPGILRAAETLIQDTRIGEDLRLTALVTGVTALRRLQDPRQREAFGRILANLGERDPSDRIREEARWTLEHLPSN